jgi:hypothetical protein
MGSALVIDVGPLLAAGRPISLDEAVELPPFGSYTFPHPARVRLELRRVERGLQIDGKLEVDVAGACDRCLEDVTAPLEVEVDERFDPPSGSSDPFAENNVLNGTSLDVSDLARQLADSALPYGLTCSSSCRGLCARCGQSKNVGGGCTCPLPMTEGDHGEPQVENSPLEDA